MNPPDGWVIWRGTRRRWTRCHVPKGTYATLCGQVIQANHLWLTKPISNKSRCKLCVAFATPKTTGATP